jgi:hypothetical protein
MRKLAILAAVVSLLALAACGKAESDRNAQLKQINHHSSQRRAYIPGRDVEFNNYNDAQKLYDSPATIVWCTTTWGNPSAPMVTLPVRSKLTSSSVSFFPTTVVRHQTNGGDSYNPELRSVDGMFHGSPPPYRYGFTPGGQYVDFFNMPTLCTTALTKFQRQQTKVSLTIDPAAQAATSRAEAALRSHIDPATNEPTAGAQRQAQSILEGASLGG